VFQGTVPWVVSGETAAADVVAVSDSEARVLLGNIEGIVQAQSTVLALLLSEVADTDATGLIVSEE
jgi:hypothetical protein